MAIYTSTGGCAGAFQTWACRDEDPVTFGVRPGIATNLSGNVTYYIVVWSSKDAPPTAGESIVQLRVALPVLPTSDICAGAESIPAAGPFPHFSAFVDTAAAQTVGDPPAPPCRPQGYRGIWYRFVPAAGGSYTFSTCVSDTRVSIFDTVLALYSATGPCSGLSLVACGDDSCINRATVAASLGAGTTNYLLLWDFEPVPIAGETVGQLVVDRQQPPNTTTLNSFVVTATNVVLRGRVSPHGVDTRGWFEWGATTNYGNLTPNRLLGSGISPVTNEFVLRGLPRNATYHYRAVATNTFGLGYGTNATFLTN
jgi:hypothetical protein